MAGVFVAAACQKSADTSGASSSSGASASSSEPAQPEALCGAIVFACGTGGEHDRTSIGMIADGELRPLGPDDHDHDHDAHDHDGHGHDGGPSRFPAAVTPDGTQLLVLVSVPTPSGKTADSLELWSLADPSVAPQPLSGIPSGAMIRNPSFSPDASYLVYESDGESFRDLYRYELEAGTVLRLTDNEQGNFEPEVGPGGQRVAFVSSRDQNAELYVMSSDGGGALRLTESPGDDSTPRWSPDGRQLAFTSARTRARGIDLFVVAADGGEARPVVEREQAVMVRDHVWSPDGRALAWTELQPKGGISTLVVVELEGARELLRTTPEGTDQQPAWSPDARHLVFSRGGRERSRLYRVGVDGSGLAPLRASAADEGGVEWLPRWVPTGCDRAAPATAPAAVSQQG